ncbi:hypothetical protein LTR84_005708 [Exophiala bonariae]|uniref:Metallo-beta-lactamase domain-containing protein n=1 Tax=Exophiala bonariae TaxID=1690606 RepID=A0AAV9N367_9EURO|nr:hypothetical protein LTR84_005708 [Exophiala bonariae]
MGSSGLFQVDGGKTVSVSIIDTTSRIGNVPLELLVTPPIPDFSRLGAVPSWSFLIEHESSGKKALFDLGIPPDWQNMSPAISTFPGWDISAQKNTIDILEANGISGSQINSIIWSHWHWDHLGDPSTFPPTTDLVVGPGFKQAFLPGFPVNKKSPVRESDFAGRNLREIDFSITKLLAGKFHAFDFFGDGSFYLLDTPGHAIGHLCGLARTTNSPDTFIMMGGDLCHHSGEMRPSPHLPLPSDNQLHEIWQRFSATAIHPCPGAVLAQLQHSRGRDVDIPFYDPAMGHDIDIAIDTIKKAQEADSDDNIWFVFAHDDSLFDTVDLFPAKANAWKEKGWGSTTKWAFLKDFKTGLLQGAN